MEATDPEFRLVVIKLNTGDDIVCHVEKELRPIDGFIIIYDPVQLHPIRSTINNRIIESTILDHWMKFSQADSYSISVDAIITMGEATDNLAIHFYRFLESTNRRAKSINTPEPAAEDDEDDDDDDDDNFLSTASNTCPPLKQTIH